VAGGENELGRERDERKRGRGRRLGKIERIAVLSSGSDRGRKRRGGWKRRMDAGKNEEDESLDDSSAEIS